MASKIRTDNQGFTLIELLMCLSLLIIAAALVFPQFTTVLATAQLDADARQLAEVLRLAREEAINSGNTQTVVFYTQNAKYLWVNHRSYYFRTGVGFVGSSTFQTRYDGKPCCYFNSSGTPGGGGSVVLKNQSKLKYVIVNPVAGRVRISDTPPDNWN
jgi:prepilin-type N-terminal cleavage/methylation domain-containing protein